MRQLAGLGTGVVTVPLFTLSWALLIPPAGSVLAGVAGTLWLTGLLGVVPLLGGVALAGALGHRQPPEPA